MRAGMPSHTPDVGEIAKDPGTYVSTHLPYVFWWCAVVLGISSFLALAGGWCVTKALARSGRTRKSSWSEWLEHSETGSYVQCFLEDGSCVSGFLLSYNEDYEETQDRDLCLLDPWYFPDANSDSHVEWFDDTAIVSAAKIKFLTVSKVPGIQGREISDQGK